MKYKVGDILREDRSQWIGSPWEYFKDGVSIDATYPVVFLRITGINKGTGTYDMWNLTREVGTIGHAKKVDTSEHVTLVREEDVHG